MHAEEKQGKNKKHSQQNIAKLQNPEARCAGRKHHPTPLWQNQKKLKWKRLFDEKQFAGKWLCQKRKTTRLRGNLGLEGCTMTGHVRADTVVDIVGAMPRALRAQRRRCSRLLLLFMRMVVVVVWMVKVKVLLLLLLLL